MVANDDYSYLCASKELAISQNQVSGYHISSQFGLFLKITHFQMYALLLSILISVSQDCPILVQLALVMDFKYTNTDYFIQYEKDCCLGVGVICENNLVTEIHWGFPADHLKNSVPVVTFPPNLRVLDLANIKKSMIINDLPSSLQILDLTYAENVIVDLKKIPYLKVLRLKINNLDNRAILPRLPDSLEELNINYFGDDYLPLNPVNLIKIYFVCIYNVNSPDILFPILPDTIEFITLANCRMYGPIAVDFKSLISINVYENKISGNLTISSPNITKLDLDGNEFDRLFVKYPEKLTFCSNYYNYFESDNESELQKLLPYGCGYNLKASSPPECPNIIEFAKQLNMHKVAPDLFVKLVSGPNCCVTLRNYVACINNKIDALYFQDLRLNGTINGTLLPPSFYGLYLGFNKLSGPFPDLKMVSLTYLSLTDNQLSGTIDNKLPNGIAYLDINSNNLNGTIPLFPGLGYLSFANNKFSKIDNTLTVNQDIDFSLENNNFYGVVDLSHTNSRYLYIQNNYIEQIIVSQPITISNCDISMNNILPGNFTNFMNCRPYIQRIDASSLDSCKYVVKMFQKLGISNPLIETNCCHSRLEYYTTVCIGKQVIELKISSTNIFKTVNGYAFDAADVPPSLQKLTITGLFNQTAIFPNMTSTNLTFLEIKSANIDKIFIKSPTLPKSLSKLHILYCNLTGSIMNLPPSLQELQIQGNYLTGPFPVFPVTLNSIILGDKAKEGNSFNDKLILQQPLSIILGSTNIYDVFIQNTSLLTNCDLSFNPLLNSTNIGNYTMCKQYYLTPKIDKLQIGSAVSSINLSFTNTAAQEYTTDSTQDDSKSSNLYLFSCHPCIFQNHHQRCFK
eukprot:NODE_668_length_4888_cov_0.964293.p1 type:complete len:854 gc:universal NODE_668_length_4888_cov_0.964293:1254-3815(+)